MQQGTGRQLTKHWTILDLFLHFPVFYLPPRTRIFRSGKGGYHPVHVGEIYNGRYHVLAKLGHWDECFFFFAWGFSCPLCLGEGWALMFIRDQIWPFCLESHPGSLRILVVIQGEAGGKLHFKVVRVLTTGYQPHLSLLHTWNKMKPESEQTHHTDTIF